MDSDLARLIMWDVITVNDLNGFSDELIERVKRLVNDLQDVY